MTVRYDTGLHTFVIDSEYCQYCGEGLYDAGCDAPGCNGLGCQDCGSGCDLDFLPDGRCATAIAEEDPADRAARFEEERAAFGFPPDSNDESEGD